MAVSIVATPTIGSNTFFRNKEFDISFSVASLFAVDTSLSFSNSTFGLSNYIRNGHFVSSSGFSAVGSAGILSVDVLSSNPRIVTTATAQSYVAAAGVCTDPSGNVYFAVANQNKVFKLDLSGTVTTFAGDGTAGDTEGPRLTAQFRAPGFVITDGSGTFYVTDNYRVRKIDPAGSVSTIAGTSARGYVDASGTTARFFTPGPMALRPNGDLLVTDGDQFTIRNVTLPGALVTTYAGKPGEAAFADGSLNVTSLVGGQFLRGANATTTLYETRDLSGTWSSNTTIDMNVRVMHVNSANADSNRVLYGGDYSASYASPLVYQPSLQSPIVAATGFDTSFDRIRTIAYDSVSSKYVASGRGLSGSNRAPYVSTNGGATWTVSANGSNLLGDCYSIAVGNGTWMAGGFGSNSSTSNLLISTDATTWTRTAAPGLFFINSIAYGNGNWAVAGSPTSSKPLATSSNDGSTWVQRDISVGSPFRTVSNLAYGAGVWVATFDLGGVLGGGPGIVYSSDLSTWTGATGSFTTDDYYSVTGLHYSTTQRKFIASITSNIWTSSNGATWTVTSNAVGAGGLSTLVDISQNPTVATTYGTARMSFPFGIIYDPSGTLYIADQYNNRIRSVVSGSNTMSTFAGSGGGSISNGTLTTAGMARPSSLARDSSGTIYVGSFERNTLQTIVGNNVSLLSGAEFTPGYVDGAVAAARFNGLAGLALFGNTLYMTEVYNGDVRKLTTLPDVRPDVFHPPGYTIVATSNYPITVNSRIDVSWTSVGGVLTLYKYEPFCNNSFRTRVSGDTLGYSTSSTELLAYLTGTGTSNVLFRSANGANVAYPSLNLIIQDFSGTTLVDDVSTSVTINPARIIITPCNTSLTFYRNEPSTNPVFSLVSSPAQVIYAASTLPAGLSFVKTSSNAFTLTGTPTVQTFASNYTILGQDTSGRTYSTQVTMIVNPERLIIDVSGSLTLSNVNSTTPIQPITFTSRFPPYNSFRAVTYSWFPAPPAGLQFGRKNGFPSTGLSQQITSSEDASFALTLSGTITAQQIKNYALSGVTSASIVLNGVRTNGGGLLSPAVPKTITFFFEEVILFDSNVPRLYVGLPVSNFYYSAKTYFPSVDTSISSIQIIDGFIPDGLDASFTKLTQRFTFAGTPTTAGSFSFTLQASNSNGTTAELPVVVTPSNDQVTITTTADSCFNFIQYRPLSSEKSGFYTDPIRYTVTALSGGNVILSGSNLPIGVSLVSTDTSGVYDLSGLPTTPSALTTATLTALVPSTGATSSKTFSYSVSAEVFTFNDLSFSFSQNVLINPVIVTATTSSEQPVIRYSSPSIPATLQIANTGRIFGTLLGDTSGSFTVTAYTPYSSGSRTYNYSVTPDSVLLQPSSYRTVTAPGCNVSIPINGYSASATVVSNYRISAGSYGLTINPTTGLLSGTLASSLPDSTTFTLTGSAGIVDGTLIGTMTTDNLTVNRAQMLGLDASSVSIYSSDDNGLTWSQIGSTYSDTAALTIGTNGSNVYLIPTSSSVVLKSTDGAVYTPKSLTGASPIMTAVANKTGTSTWWIAGSVVTGSDRAVYIYKSTDDGDSWDSGFEVPSLTDRGGNIEPYPISDDAYINGGVALAYKDGVLLIGGDRILRSTDDGLTWSSVGGGFISEVAYFSLDQDTVWIAAGSDLYQSRTSLPYAGATSTIKYSVDAGLTWTNASAFNMFAYEVRYGLGQWMATGIDWVGPSEEVEVRVRYSFDGITWTILSAVPAIGYASAFTKSPPLPITLGFDETDWVLFRTPDDGTITRYAHPYSTPLTSGWVSQVIGPPPTATSTSRFTSYVAQTIDPGADVTTITFPLPNTGPVFTSPAQSTFILWQYMPVPAITFLAPGATSYFVSALPIGLTWDPVARTITGSVVQTGTQTFTVYAQNSGLTAFVVTLIVEVPRIIKQQSGAGAYTSLLRQYTTVNAAQKARDTRAFPTQVSGIGEFASPYPPDVITQSNCPC
jgi:hypothetical protein